MDTAVSMVPTTGVFALCMALGLARATFYRRRRTAAPLHAEIPASEKKSARSLVAVRGHEAEGANVPPTEPVSTADVEAARNEANVSPIDVVAAKKTSPRALSQGERARVLAMLNEDRFCNLAPAEIYATLLDEGQYLCVDGQGFPSKSGQGRGS